MAPDAPSTITASPGFKTSPASSSKRYATQYSRSIAACSSGIKSFGILRNAFSFAQNNERHAPTPGWRGSTQSPSASALTPAPTFKTSPMKSPPATESVVAEVWPWPSMERNDSASFSRSLLFFRASTTKFEPASAPRPGARSAGFTGDARTCTNTCPHSSVFGIGLVESANARETPFCFLPSPSGRTFSSPKTLRVSNAAIFGKRTSSYDPLTTPYASTMSSTPMVRFASPRVRIQASNPAECEWLASAFLVFTNASARVCFSKTSSTPRSLNAPPPNASRSSSSTDRSTTPFAS